MGVAQMTKRGRLAIILVLAGALLALSVWAVWSGHYDVNRQLARLDARMATVAIPPCLEDGLRGNR
jgi:hypothetical protein